MKSLSRENQADITEAFNSTSRYLDDLLDIDNIYFDLMVDRIYPTERQLNKANSSDTEVPFLDLNLCISNGTVFTKIYDKRDDFDFDIVNILFLDGDVPRCTSYRVYISQLIRFAKASTNLSDFKCRNKALTAKLLRQGCRDTRPRADNHKKLRRTRNSSLYKLGQTDWSFKGRKLWNENWEIILRTTTDHIYHFCKFYENFTKLYALLRLR